MSSAPPAEHGQTKTNAIEKEIEKEIEKGAIDQIQPASPSEVDEGNKETPEGPIEDAQKYPTGLALVAITAALLLSVFLVALDRTIIATAIPRITDEFDSLGDVGWYASGYLFTFASFQLLFGRIYTFYNPKWVMLAAILIFEVGSTVCGAAPNSAAFIVGRAIAGLGAAGVFGGGIIIILHAVPLHKRPMFQGLFGAVFGISSVLGPLMGGAFTSGPTWRWCFYINLPIGGVAMGIIALILKLDVEKRRKFTLWEQFVRLDPIGTLLLLSSVVSFLLALQWGGSTYPWGDWRVILCFVFGGVLGIGYILVQMWMQDLGSLPPRIAKNRSVIASTIYAMCCGSSMMVFIYYIPIWFQAIKNSSPIHSGIQNLPSILGLVTGSIIGGVSVTKIGYVAPNMYVSTVLATVGAGLITTWTVHTGHAKWIGYQVLWGFPFGLGFQQANIAVQAALPKADAATGISFTFFGMMMGGAVFASVAQNIFTNKLVEGITKLGSVSPEKIVNTGATDLHRVLHGTELEAVRVVYNHALVSAFYVAVALSAFSIVGAVLVEWISVKKPKPPANNSQSAVAPQEAV